MRLRKLRHRAQHFQDPGVLRTAHPVLQELVERLTHDVPRNPEEHHAHEEGGNRVEHHPLPAEDRPRPRTDRRCNRGERVAPMVPGVGEKGVVGGLNRHLHRPLIEILLYANRDQPRPKSHQGRSLRERPKAERRDNALARVEEDRHAHGAERDPHQDGSERLILPVTVGVVAIFGLARQAHPDEYGKVRREVGTRVHGVGNHRSRMPHHAHNQLPYRKDAVDKH